MFSSSSSFSKSPSCDEGQADGAENVPTADEIQEAVAEELRSPDRIMSQRHQSMGSRGASATYTSPQGAGSYQAPGTQSRGSYQAPGTQSRGSYQAPGTQSRGSYQATGAQSRVSYHPSASSRPPTAPQSRIPSPRGASCEEEPPLQSSPPVTPATYGSRAVSIGTTRGAPPEVSSQYQPTSYLEMAQKPEQSREYCADEEESPHPDSSQYMRGPSQRSVRGTPASSHPSMRGMPDPSHASMRGASAYSHPSMRGMPDPSHPSMRGASAYSHPSMRGVPDPSQASVRPGASACPSMREGALSSNRGTPSGSRSAALGTGVGPSMVTFGNKESMAYVPEDPSSMPSYRTVKDPSLLAQPPSYSRQTVSGVEVGISGIGLSSSGLADMGVDAATSAMSYGMQNERAAAGAGCVPGCKTFMRDIQNVPSSTPCNMSRDPGYDQSQFGYSEQPSTGIPSGGGGKAPQHHMMSHESGYHTLSGPTPNFDRGATPPSYQSYKRAPSPADGEHHHHHHAEGHEGLPERDDRVVAALGHLSQFKKTPSYFRCGLGDDLDFLKVCCPKVKEAGRTGPGKVAAFPDIPCLRQEDIDELIKCEAADVESAWFLTSDERKTYKKPCPKQQKAQMTVKALVQAHTAQTCGKEYSPLEHPDPEDISPEVAAAMMFSQERGIKMEECPNYTITSLFPDEPKTPFPEKIPASSISIVDRNSKDQEEMIEKSASVPSEGVSDSAYTRTMKEKGSEDMGAQKSFDVDFAIGQSKREYVIVAQKPQRVNKVQYRGGNSPPGFPGYFSAFPDEEGLKVVSSPSDLLHKAWIHSNPGNMPTSDVIVLE